MMNSPRRIPWDWHDGVVPQNVVLDETAYIQTSFCFHSYRSTAPVGLRVGRGASICGGTMLDLGTRARVVIGDYAIVNGAWIIGEEEIEIGNYALLSWRVVLMESYRMPFDPLERRLLLERFGATRPRVGEPTVSARPIHIGRNVWIGFDSCILPGVAIGEGSIVGARSVVVEDVAPFTIVAGNPARTIRKIN